MVIEQLLKDWIAERSAAADLTVAARTAKSIATEIEAYYHDAIARAEAAVAEKGQLLAEKERNLSRSLEIISRLEGQLAQLRDQMDRGLLARDQVLAEKDRILEQHVQLLGRLEGEFAAVRESLESRLQSLDREVDEKSRSIAAREESLAVLEKEILEKSRMIETYRKKFGVIMKAVG